MNTDPIQSNISQANEIGVDLMITDAKTALTLLDLAETTRNPGDRARRVEEAHRAYRTIQRFLARLSPSPGQREVLAEKMKVLAARLRRSGVAVE